MSTERALTSKLELEEREKAERQRARGKLGVRSSGAVKLVVTGCSSVLIQSSAVSVLHAADCLGACHASRLKEVRASCGTVGHFTALRRFQAMCFLSR